ncbi:MAG: DPP IV N-terminal domain-containing protein, partial [bacterium]
MVNKITGSLLSLVIISVSSYTYAFTPKKVIIPAKDIKEVLPIQCEFSSPNYVTYSPDGTKILYTLLENYLYGVIIFEDLITGSETCLTYPYEIDTPADGDAREPDFSPDGTQIVFSLKKDKDFTPQIWKMDVDGSNKRQLTTFKEEFLWLSPKWSPDGKKILVYLAHDHICLINVEDWSVIKIPSAIGGARGDWSPDGKKIALINKHNLWIINFDGTNPVQVTTDGKADSDYAPSWSPDGSKIAYTKVGKHYGDWNNSIVIINVDGSDPTELILPNELGGNCPDWSPNGKEIIFVGVKDITGPYERPKSAAGIYILTLPPELQSAPKKGIIGKMGKRRDGEVFEVTKVKGNMVIDSILSEKGWGDVKKISMNKKEDVIYKPSNWQGEEDLSALAMVQGDDKNLYLAIAVKDDNFVQPFTGDNILKGDHLEFWFETPKGIYQFGLSPGDFEKIVPEVLVWLPKLSNQQKQDMLRGIKIASIKTKTGYNLEAKIPLANLG